MDFKDRKNILRDISILAGYTMHKDYDKIAKDVNLTKSRIRYIVQDLFKLFRHTVTYEFSYDVVNDIFTVSPYLRKDMYICIKQARKQYIRNKIYGSYWEHVLPHPAEYMKQVEMIYTDGSLLGRTEEEVKAWVRGIKQELTESAMRNDTHIHDNVVDTLSEYGMKLTETQEQYLHTFPKKSVFTVGGDDYLISIEYVGINSEQKLSIGYDGNVSYTVGRFSQRTRRDGSKSYIKLDEQSYFHASE